MLKAIVHIEQFSCESRQANLPGEYEACCKPNSTSCKDLLEVSATFALFLPQKFGLHPVFDRPMANKGWMSTAWLEPYCQCTKESSDSMWPRVAVANVEHHRASAAGTVT